MCTAILVKNLSLMVQTIYFSMSILAQVLLDINVWTLLMENGLLPENAAKISYLLWTMYFLKYYTQTGEDVMRLHQK